MNILPRAKSARAAVEVGAAAAAAVVVVAREVSGVRVMVFLFVDEDSLFVFEVVSNIK